MRFVIAFVAFVAVAAAAPQNPADTQATIVREESDINPDGSFKFSYETSQGIAQTVHGEVKQNTLKSSPEDPDKVVTFTGEYSYPGPDGQTYSVRYTADENGFRPEVSIDFFEANIGYDFVEQFSHRRKPTQKPKCQRKCTI